MKKTKLILPIIFVIAAAAVLYFAYGVVKKRYLSPAKNSGTNNSATQNQAGSQTDNQNADQSGDQVSTPSEVDNTAPASGQPNVQSSDCDNNCAQYKDNADNLKYCQEVCGDRPVAPKDSADQCANLSGLDQNSCWRDLAVSKKDFSICDKISDAKLQKVCRNRVTEEVLN
ncbi:MAG: hypothetical protein NT170_02495 [Candidatus Moranbacteria bacterium]|nr:hypothetical protein [Candidatus Moranbacteria bacterium]